MSADPNSRHPFGPTRNAARGSQPTWRLNIARWMIWVMVLLIIGPCIATEAPREVARWHLAAAIEAEDAGHQQLVDQHLTNAIHWSPSDPLLLVKRAQRRTEAGDYALALEDCNRADELFPENPTILGIRSQVLHHMDRHEEALRDCKIIDRVSLSSGTPNRPQALNALAYACAVGNQELESGLKAVDEALAMDPGNGAMLDTRGFLLYRLGRYQEALKAMNPAVQSMEREYRLNLRPEVSPITRRLNDPFNLAGDGVLKTAAAVGRYHRALVLEKLGQFAAAKADRARARQLIGREPDESLF